MKMTFLMAISVSLLFGCNQMKNDKSEKSNVNIQSNEVLNGVVSLSLTPNVFKLSQLPEIVEVQMTNNSNDTITTGLHYTIEHYQNNEWKEVSPKGVVFHDLGWRLKPTDTENFEKKLYKDKIKYETGKHRIVKYYLKSDFLKTNQNFNVYAEFFIE